MHEHAVWVAESGHGHGRLEMVVWDGWACRLDTPAAMRGYGSRQESDGLAAASRQRCEGNGQRGVP